MSNTIYDYDDKKRITLECKEYLQLNIVIQKIDRKEFMPALQGPVNPISKEDPLPENVYISQIYSKASNSFEVLCVFYNDCIFEVLINLSTRIFPKWEFEEEEEDSEDEEDSHFFEPFIRLHREDLIEDLEVDEYPESLNPHILWDITVENHVFYVSHVFGINQVFLPSISVIEDSILKRSEQPIAPVINSSISKIKMNISKRSYKDKNPFLGFSLIFGFGPLLILSLDRQLTLEVKDINDLQSYKFKFFIPKNFFLTTYNPFFLSFQVVENESVEDNNHKKKFEKILKILKELKKIEITQSNFQIDSKVLDNKTLQKFSQITQVYFEKIEQLSQLKLITQTVEEKHNKIVIEQKNKLEQISQEIENIEENNNQIDYHIYSATEKISKFKERINKLYSIIFQNKPLTEEETKFKKEMINLEKNELLKFVHNNNEKLTRSAIHSIMSDITQNNKIIIHLKGDVEGIFDQLNLYN